MSFIIEGIIKIRQGVQDLKQLESEPIDEYVHNFSLEWDFMYKDLDP